MLCDLRVDARLCPRRLVATSPDWPCLPSLRSARLAGPPAVACSLTQLPMGFCKAHATCLPTPDNHRSSLNRKAHGPRGSMEGRPRANHRRADGLPVASLLTRPLCLTARIAMASWDG